MWNEAQKKAIETKDKNILISASAGAGKTSVLIARLMHLIQEEQYGVDEILAMTFSEAAAAEMKKRLAKALYDTLQKDKNNEHIKQQLVKLNTANISTIHGFCLHIIQTYYYMVDLDAKRIQHPIEDSQASYLRNMALQQVLQVAYAEDGFIPFSLSFTSRPERDGSLVEDIVALAALANSKAEPLVFLEACKQRYQEVGTLQDMDQEVIHYFIDSFRIKTSLLLDLLMQTIIELDDGSLQDKKMYYEAGSKALDVNDYKQYRLLFMQGMKVKLPAESKATYIGEMAKKEKDILALLFEEETFIKQHNTLVHDIHYFIDLTMAYLQAYEHLKKVAGVIDFNDMEQYAIKILKADNAYVAGLYRNQFKEIMVDEFQDSNDVQDELVRLIARDNNVFRVGDIKQSIYGFRHALPSIMRGIMQQQGEKDELIFLSYNYRSTKTIVDFNNQLFACLMNEKGLTSSYLAEDFVTTGTPKQEAIAIPITMHLITKKKGKEDPFVDYTSKELKTSYLAHRIEELIQQGYAYKDIVILTRGNEVMNDIKDALDEVNIPCFYNKKKGFYHSSSVQSVICFLRALYDWSDDIAFLSVLTSPIYQKDVEYLAKVKLAKGSISYGSFLKEEKELFSFYELRKQVRGKKVSEILQTIYNLNNFYMEYANAQEKANLDMLYDMVCTYESEAAISLSGFLQYLDQQKDIEVGEAMPIGSEDDVVRIMTIHKSKGLQFKVVLLYSSSKFKAPESSGIVALDETMKVGMKYVDKKTLVSYPTITSLAIKQKHLQEYLEEEQRLLYVATTRAQERLEVIDIGAEKEVEAYSINEFYKLEGYTGLLRKALVGMDNELFQYHYIDTIWENKIMQTEEGTYQFKLYNIKAEGTNFASPSDSEIKIVKPQSFSLSEDVGFERGTNLHKMVEHLSNGEWDAKVLDEVAKQHRITLTEHDREVLLALSSQEVFQKASQYETCYHEYPFMIRSNHKIIHGFMDFLAVSKNEVIMIDFKSDRGVDESILHTRYDEQIKAYHKALIKLYPEYMIKTYMYSFELERMIAVDV